MRLLLRLKLLTSFTRCRRSLHPPSEILQNLLKTHLSPPLKLLAVDAKFATRPLQTKWITVSVRLPTSSCSQWDQGFQSQMCLTNFICELGILIPKITHFFFFKDYADMLVLVSVNMAINYFFFIFIVCQISNFHLTDNSRY